MKGKLWLWVLVAIAVVLVVVIFLVPKKAHAATFGASGGQNIVGGFGDNVILSETDWSPIIGTSLYFGVGKTHWIVEVMQTTTFQEASPAPLPTVGSVNYVVSGEVNTTDENAFYFGPQVIVSRWKGESHGGAGFNIGATLFIGEKSRHNIGLFGRWIDKEGWSAGIAETLGFNFP